jgi:hypothetical protein
MKNALENLDELITNTLPPEHLMTGALTDEQTETWITEVVAEKEGIGKYLVHAFIGVRAPTEQEFEQLIGHCEAELIYLLDTVFHYRNASDGSQLSVLYTRLIGLLEEMLSDLQQHYRHYFNEGEEMPVNYLLLQRMEMRKRLPRIKRVLLRQTGDRELCNIVLKRLADFAIDSSTGIFTYRAVNYLKELATALEGIGKGAAVAGSKIAEGEVAGSMMEILLYLNYNDVDCYDYYAGHMREELGQQADGKGKREKLKEWKARIKRIFEKPGTSLEEPLPSLKGLLMVLLQEEWELLEKNSETGSAGMGGTCVAGDRIGLIGNISEMELPATDSAMALPAGELLAAEQTTGRMGVEYIEWDLSVIQLALLIRACKDTGLITNRHKAEVLRLVAQVSHTVRSVKNIYDQLDKLYYLSAKDLRVIDKVKDVLIRLVNYVIILEKEAK